MQRKSSMDTGMQRQFSGSCSSIGLSRRASTATPHALGTVAEAAEAAAGNHKLLGIVSVCAAVYLSLKYILLSAWLLTAFAVVLAWAAVARSLGLVRCSSSSHDQQQRHVHFVSRQLPLPLHCKRHHTSANAGSA
jgi:hypothetical protein